MSLLVLWSSAVLAAAPTAQLAGIGDAQAVALLLERGGEVAGVACNDAGADADATPDGIWTCGPLPVTTGAVRVGLVRDGKLLDAGDVTLEGEGFTVRVDGGAVVLASGSGGLPAPRPGAPAPGTTTLLARVRGVGDGPAPVLRIQGPEGSAELVCRDDGVFPDAERNDGEHGCAGVAPGTRGEVSVNGVSSGSFGSVSWDRAAAFAFVVVDAAARTARIEAFALPGFAPVSVTGAPGGQPDAVPRDQGVPEAPPPGPAPVPPAEVAPPQPEDTRGRSPVASREVGGGASPLAVVAALALGLVGGWGWRRRAGRLPASLQIVAAPPLLGEGPVLARSAAVSVPDPVALARTLLGPLARHRRVVLVAPHGALFDGVAEGPVFRAASGDCEEVEAGVRALAGTPGPAVAVLVVGDDTLSDAGAAVPDAVGRLLRGLPPGVWLGVVVSGAPPAGLDTWTAEGPPWRLRRAVEAGVDPAVAAVPA